MRDDKKLLVVGGTGFIGKTLALKASLIGYRVTILSSRNTHSVNRIPGIEYVIGDITDQRHLSSILKKRHFTHVVNLAGYVNHSGYYKDGEKIISQHFDGVRNLVQCLNRDALECFLQIGSSDEYGNNPSPQLEYTREMPISPYSFGKVASTHLLQMLHLTEGFPSVVCRIFIVFGPFQGFNRLIPSVISASLKNQSFPVSAGMQLRDFCYIDDVVDALLLALDDKHAHGHVINIGSGTPRPVRDVVETIVRIVGKGTPRFGEIEYRKGENMSLYADISKAKSLLNWSPKTDFVIGLSRTIDFYSGQH